MKIDIFHQPEARLCAQIENERCVLGIKPVWAAPLSRPQRYLALLDAKGEDVALFADPEKELSADSLQAVLLEIRRRDLTSRISSIVNIREESGAAYFSVLTDRGERDFVATNLSTNAIWFGEDRLLLIDTEGNRFEIESITGLDNRSQGYVESIL